MRDIFTAFFAFNLIQLRLTIHLLNIVIPEREELQRTHNNSGSYLINETNKYDNNHIFITMYVNKSEHGFFYTSLSVWQLLCVFT